MQSLFLRSRYKAIDRQHKAEAEEYAVGRKAAAAADVCLRHHVVNDNIQHRSGCKGERKRQYAARERYGKVAEKYTGHLDRTAYERNYCRAFFARSGFQKRRYYNHGLRNVLKRNAASHSYGVGEVSRSEAHSGGYTLGKVMYRNGRDE